jgi:hypothetical protein
MIGSDSYTGEGDHLAEILMQDPASFSAAQFKGNYVMDTTGTDDQVVDGRFGLGGRSQQTACRLSHQARRSVIPSVF